MRKLFIIVIALLLIGLVAFVLGSTPMVLALVQPAQSVVAPLAQPEQPPIIAPAVIQPSAPKLSPESKKVFDEGNKQIRAKNYDAAIAAYQKIVQAQPDAPDGYLALGRAYGAAKNYDQAIDVLQVGTAALPNNLDMLLALGQTYTARGFHVDPRCGSPHSGIGASPGTKDDKFLREQWIAKADADYDAALVVFNRVLVSNPTNVPAHDGIAYALYRQGKYDRAVGWAEKAVQLAPKESRRYVAVANDYRRLGDVANALAWFDKALAVNIRDYGAIKYLWETYAQQKNWDGAIARLTQITGTDPQNVEASLRLAQAYDKKGDLASALMWYEYTLKLDSQLGEAYKYVAPIYKKLGDTAKYEAALRNAEWYKEK